MFGLRREYARYQRRREVSSVRSVPVRRELRVPDRGEGGGVVTRAMLTDAATVLWIVFCVYVVTVCLFTL